VRRGNARNQRFRVKFHRKTRQGIKDLADQQAEASIAKNRESHRKDLCQNG
jgi:catalase